LASLDERVKEAVVLRTLGAQRNFLQASLAAEFISLGLMAGLLAAAGAEAFAYYVSTAVFELAFAFHPWVWLVGPASGALLVLVFGSLATRRVTTVAPMTALRETG
jgi:putative ABC transport system permease protein